VIVAHGPAAPRAADAIRALLAIGARLLVIADERVGSELPSSEPGWRFDYPAVPEPLSPVAAVLPLQLLASSTATLLGTNPDDFRFGDRAYKSAVEGYTL
jgi:glucosamine 6-phosphate synthetase-like amidotransferase/phosphosugar isomerase protein